MKMRSGMLALASGLFFGCSGGVGAEPLTTTTAADSRDAPPQGTISASSLSLFEAETRVAHAPDGSIAAVWISNTDSPANGGFQSIGYSVFRPGDGSRPGDREGTGRWSAPQLITVPGAFYHSDPTVTVNRRGDFFFAFLAGSGPILPPDNLPVPPDDVTRAYVAKLPRGQATALAPVQVSDPGPTDVDKPWIEITPRGTLLVSFADFYDYANGLAHSVVSRSTDDGATWTTTVADEDPYVYLPQVCVPADGRRVYLIDNDGGSGMSHGDAAVATHGKSVPHAPTPGPTPFGQPAVHLHWSDDDGATWNAGGTFNTWPVDDYATYSIPTCAAHGDDVWIAATVASTEDFPPLAETVRVAHFVDRGSTYVSDSVPDFGGAFFYQQPLVVAGEDGQLDVLTHVDTSYTVEETNSFFARVHAEGPGGRWGQPQVLARNLWNFGKRHGIGFQGDYWGAWPLPGGGLDVTFVPTFKGEPQHVSYLRLDD